MNARARKQSAHRVTDQIKRGDAKCFVDIFKEVGEPLAGMIDRSYAVDGELGGQGDGRIGKARKPSVFMGWAASHRGWRGENSEASIEQSLAQVGVGTAGGHALVSDRIGCGEGAQGSATGNDDDCACCIQGH